MPQEELAVEDVVLPAPDEFWSKVDRGDDDECWEWQAAKNGEGYGYYWFEGKNFRAHRVALALSGVDVEGYCALHHCDNPSCVNPSHLYAGDKSDNARDAFERGRRELPDNEGEDHSQTSLTENDVADIRRRYENEEITQKELADEYGMERSSIGNIINGYNW